MVSTIAPLVKVARMQWLKTFIALALGSVLGGATTGAVLGAAGSLLIGEQTLNPAALVLLACGLVPVELRVLRVPIPTLYRSVPQRWWRVFGPIVGAFLYGLVLGVGFTTFIPFISFYFVAAAAFVLGHPGGLLVGLTYGASRIIPVLVASIAVTMGADPLRVGDWGLGDRRLQARRLCAFGLVVTAIGFALV